MSTTTSVEAAAAPPGDPGDDDQAVFAGAAAASGAVLAPIGLAGWCADTIDADLVLAALGEVIDPELGVDIVGLGLVYGIVVDEGRDVTVRMTLTTPGCPLGGYLDDEVRACLRQFTAVRSVDVVVVWDPPWRPEMMTDRARAQLGWSR